MNELDRLMNASGPSESPMPDGQRIIRDFRESIDFIQTNWTDEVGGKFVGLLQAKEIKLRELERKRSLIFERMLVLESKYRNILNDSSENDDDIAVKKLTLHKLDKGRW